MSGPEGEEELMQKGSLENLHTRKEKLGRIGTRGGGVVRMERGKK